MYEMTTFSDNGKSKEQIMTEDATFSLADIDTHKKNPEEEQLARKSACEREVKASLQKYNYRLDIIQVFVNSIPTQTSVVINVNK